MAAPQPSNIRELRYLSGTAFNTEFVDADSTAWAAGTATKLRILSFEAATEYQSEEAPELEAQMYSLRPPVPTIRVGGFKFSTWMEGANTDSTDNPVATLLGKILGGVQGPADSNRTVASDAITDSDMFGDTGINTTVKAGMAALVGSRGDSRGDAYVGVISTTDATSFSVSMAFTDSIDTSDSATISTTVFYDDEATQQYVDFLAVGKSAEDQIQAIGCQGMFTFEDIGPGQAPKIAFDFMCADWQEVASGARDQLEPTSAAQGNLSATLRGLGGFWIGDQGSTTRTEFKCAELSIDPGLTLEPHPGYNGVNGKEGWKIVRGVPTFEATILLEGNADPLPGFYDDFTAGTAKQVLIQWGTTAGKTVAIDFPNAYFDTEPRRTDAGPYQAIKITGHGHRTAFDRSTADDALEVSPMRLHFM